MTKELLGTDLKLSDEYWKRGDLQTDLETATKRNQVNDLALVTKHDNLVQALTVRLLTPKGALAKLGHPNYGSRLHELIGELNNVRTRGIAKLYCKETILQDPRVEEILGIEVKSVARNRVDVFVELLPINEAKPLNLVFPFLTG
ncbi:MAG: hypothetical protein ABH870_06355 [bacterium]